MNTKSFYFSIFFIVVLLAGFSLSDGAGDQTLSAREQLGKSIFFDKQLSLKRNQSCATCHDPEAGWTGPDSAVNAREAVYEGSVHGLSGNRKPPSAAYAATHPKLHLFTDTEENEQLFVGGNFWDGRATGEELGNPVADQAKGPFLNPVEQALPDMLCVVYRVCNPVTPYPVSFEEVWGDGVCEISWPENLDKMCAQKEISIQLPDREMEKVSKVFDKIALSIAGFEASKEVNPFSSKFDKYMKGEATLTDIEQTGFDLFKNKGKCAECHVLDPGPGDTPPLFTDFTYDNLGIPKNLENPFYTMPLEVNSQGRHWVDNGLGGFLQTRPDFREHWLENIGKHKVPTLRNIDKRPHPDFVKSYGHNGYFKDLKQIVHFYNTRDTLGICWGADGEIEGETCWPPPEVTLNVNLDELGDLKLTEAEEDAIVAFLKTLTDGHADQANSKEK
jgi:cytochrome c peroxidase